MSAVRATLKQLHSPDVFDLEAYSPDDKTCFGFLLQAIFGPENADGEVLRHDRLHTQMAG
jgi:hypothetical protein